MIWRRMELAVCTPAIMMTSSNGNIFRVTGPYVRGIHRRPAQRPGTRSFDIFFDLRLNRRLSKNNRDTGDLRRYRAHYDVIVMVWKILNPNLAWMRNNEHLLLYAWQDHNVAHAAA